MITEAELIKLSPKPGDLIILYTKHLLTCEQHERIIDAMKKRVPAGVECVVIYTNDFVPISLIPKDGILNNLLAQKQNIERLIEKYQE
jgi:hypothetical protein